MATVGDVLRLGADHHAAGRFDEAMALYRLVLRADPPNSDAWRLLGKAAERAGDRKLALMCLQRWAAMCPADAVAFAGLGGLLEQEGDSAKAAASYGAAVRCNPLMAQAAFQRAMLLYRMGAAVPAAAAFRMSILAAPDQAMAYINQGAALQAAGCPDQAAVCLARGCRLAPDALPGAINSALVAAAGGRHRDAERSGRRVVFLSPDAVQGYDILASTHVQQGDVQRGVALYDLALRIDPENGGLRVNRGVARLLAGELAEGWDDLFARWAVAPPLRATALLGLPRWSGGSVPAGRLLVWGETGVGDEILFASLVPDLVQAGIACVVECDARLVPLLERSLPRVEVIARPGDPAASSLPPRCTEVTAQVPASDLPRHLRRTAASFASQRPYLVADSDKVRALRRRTGDAGLRIGISWRSAASTARSLPLAQFTATLAPLLEPARGQLISLQYGVAEEERAVGGLVHDRGIDPIADLDGFAALVAAMDLVITVDNTTAHVAGGLGVSAWVLLPFVPAWFWGMEAGRTPWYPSLRLFRQSQPGDWDGVLAAVSGALAERLASGDKGARAAEGEG